ncbi:MAG: hypothetical protein IGS39_19735 [Calothrix sp. C42_A2020_038]|nr:hypothetical protein [Calothrix sp. C42_A2020_038]
MNKGLDFSDFENIPKSVWEQREKLKGLARFKYDMKTFMIDPAVSQIHAKIEPFIPHSHLLLSTKS